jgi:hypothetical protein
MPAGFGTIHRNATAHRLEHALRGDASPVEDEDVDEGITMLRQALRGGIESWIAPLLFCAVLLLAGRAAAEVSTGPMYRLADFKPGAADEARFLASESGTILNRFSLVRQFDAGDTLSYHFDFSRPTTAARLEVEVLGDFGVAWSTDQLTWNDATVPVRSLALSAGMNGRQLLLLDVNATGQSAIYVRLQAQSAGAVHRVCCLVDTAQAQLLAPGSADEAALLQASTGATLQGGEWVVADAGNLTYKFSPYALPRPAQVWLRIKGNVSLTYSRNNNFYFNLTGVTTQTDGDYTIYQADLTALFDAQSTDVYLRISDKVTGNGTGFTHTYIGRPIPFGVRDGDAVSLRVSPPGAAGLTADFAALDSNYDAGDERAVTVNPGTARIDYLVSASNNRPNGTRQVAVRDGATLLANVDLVLANETVDWVPLIEGMGPCGERTLVASLAGLVNREGPRIYMDEGASIATRLLGSSGFEDFTDDDWLYEVVDANGFDAVNKITNIYTQLLPKYASHYQGVVICDDGSYFDPSSDANPPEGSAPEGWRDSYASIRAGHALEAEYGWYLANSQLAGNAGWDYYCYRAANKNQWWIYQIDLPDDVQAATIKLRLKQSGLVSIATPAGVDAGNHTTFNGTQILDFNTAEFRNYRVDISSFLASNPTKTIYVKIQGHPTLGDAVFDSLEVDNGKRNFLEEVFSINLATTLAGVYNKLICSPDTYYVLQRKGLLKGGREFRPNGSYAEFEPGTSLETPHVWYDGGTGAGGTGGTGDRLYRYAWQARHWVYEFDLPDDAQTAVLRLRCKQNGMLSVATPAGVNTADHSVFTGTKVAEFRLGTSEGNMAVDLTPYLANNPTRKLYVKFESFNEAIDGILIFHAKMDSGYAAFTPAGRDQAVSDEAMWDAGDASIGSGLIFTDGAQAISYRLQGPADMTKGTLQLDVSNQFKVSLSSNGTAWTKVAEETRDIRDASNRQRLTLDLAPYLNAGLCFVRVEDSQPSNGWGTSLYELRVIPDPSQVEVFDVRGLWKKPEDAYRWMHRTVGPSCGQEILGMNGAPYKADRTTYVGSKSWWGPIDYLVSKGAFTFYYDMRESLYSGMEPVIREICGNKSILNCPYAYGWSNPEHSGAVTLVPLLSSYDITLLGAERLARNVSFFQHQSRMDVKDFRQEVKPGITPQNNKIYITFLKTDADNTVLVEGRGMVHWMRPERGTQPFGWGWLPMAVDILPGMMQHFYRTRSPNDYFVSGVGGPGYTMIGARTTASRNTLYAQTKQIFHRNDLRLGWLLERLPAVFNPATDVPDYVDKTGVDGLFLDFQPDDAYGSVAGTNGVAGTRQVPYFWSLNGYSFDTTSVLNTVILPRLQQIRDAGATPGFVFVAANGWVSDTATIQMYRNAMGADVVILRPDEFVNTYRIYKGLPVPSVPQLQQTTVTTARVVTVRFNETMDATALDPANYTISGIGRGTLSPHPFSVAVIDAVNHVYRLTWSSGEMVQGGNVTITAANVGDAQGTAIGLDDHATHAGGGKATLPQVSAVELVDPAQTQAATVTFRVIFSEPIQGISLAAITLKETGGLSGSQLLSLLPDGGSDRYLVQVRTGVGSGTLGIDISDPAYAISDSAGNWLAGPYTTGPVYIINRTQSTVLPAGWIHYSF